MTAGTKEPSADDVEFVTSGLAASRKYRAVAPAALARVARDALRAARDRDDALKRAKRRLHQAIGAFIAPVEFVRVERIVDALPAAPDREPLRAACREVLRRHASTRERAEPDDDFYARIWAITGRPDRVVDLGCGLHPFALPWMGLARECEYVACDIDGRVVSLVERLFTRCAPRGRALAADLLGGSEPSVVSHSSASVAFAMKLLPTLERQREGAALELLESLRARHVVVTFPAASLGGRAKGMDDHYARFLKGLVARGGGKAFATTHVPGNRESTWVLTRRPGP